jgi:hypothetical protein
LAVAIALLYLWNVTRGRHEVATYWLWERALARRPAWFRLRFWLSLATQIVILLLLVAALAEPYWPAAVAGRRTLVLVLDVSASMSATDVMPSRLAAAQAEAKRIVQGLQPGERMAILSVGSLVRIACRMTGEPQALQAAIDGISPTDGSTHMQEAVELARRVLDGRPNPQIVLLTDGCFAQAEAIARDEHVVLKRFGDGGRNFAVTRLAVRPDLQDPAQQLVMVETANHSDLSAKVPLNLAIQGGKPQTTAVELAAGAVAETTMSLPVETSGMLSAQLAVDDDLTADNQARVPVTSRRRPGVFLVSAGPPAVAAAVRTTLEALAGIDLQVVEQFPATLPAQSVAVLYGQVPPSLPDCPLLVIAPQGPCDLWDIAGTVSEGPCAVQSVRRDLPLLAGVRFEDVVVEEAVKLQFKHPAQTLVAATSGDPLYSLVQRSTAGPVLVLHVDLRKDKSDLALRGDFPRLIEQAVRWLTGTADSVTFAVGSDEPVAKPGSDEPSPTPVNIVSGAESDIRAGASVPSREVLSPAPTREQPLWMLLAGLAVVLLLIEWCLFHRRVFV